jgi:rhodanese-related sulfurtransferase
MKELIEQYETKGRAASGMVVMDVRGEEEVRMTGKLSEHTHTLPLPYINQRRAFALDEEEFEEAFGFMKPQLDEMLVFTCKAGVRSDYAAQIAGMEGYTNLINYTGGANEWFYSSSLEW